ncbi:unnamed protein product [Ilex paraguariensis]|uniref:Uncharacterized protein n=1 Tax=Ilex paraguariensis TaxID=185542 RepID=A0ABC8RI71_9AQUA
MRFQKSMSNKGEDVDLGEELGERASHANEARRSAQTANRVGTLGMVVGEPAVFIGDERHRACLGEQREGNRVDPGGQFWQAAYSRGNCFGAKLMGAPKEVWTKLPHEQERWSWVSQLAKRGMRRSRLVRKWSKLARRLPRAGPRSKQAWHWAPRLR